MKLNNRTNSEDRNAIASALNDLAQRMGWTLADAERNLPGVSATTAKRLVNGDGDYFISDSKLRCILGAVNLYNITNGGAMAEVVKVPAVYVEPAGPSPVAFAEINGVQMGVMPDGSTFMSERGLANACGVDQRAIQKWSTKGTRGDDLQGSKLAETLMATASRTDDLYSRITVNGVNVNAYPESLCMAFLEHYAFHAGANCTDKARQAFVAIASKGLRGFVYEATGYQQPQQQPQPVTLEQYIISLDKMRGGEILAVSAQVAEVRQIATDIGYKADQAIASGVSAMSAAAEIVDRISEYDPITLRALFAELASIETDAAAIYKQRGEVFLYGSWRKPLKKVNGGHPVSERSITQTVSALRVVVAKAQAQLAEERRKGFKIFNNDATG